MEITSPWLLYLILQLDSIKLAAGITALISSVTVLMLVCEQAPVYAKRAKIAGFGLLLPAVLIVVLLPSTKTAAAVVVIPAIANNATARQEAGELYQLAKQALVNAAELPDEEN